MIRITGLVTLLILISLHLFSQSTEKISIDFCSVDSNQIKDEIWLEAGTNIIVTKDYDKAIAVLHTIKDCAVLLENDHAWVSSYSYIAYCQGLKENYDRMKISLDEIHASIDELSIPDNDMKGIKADLFFLLGEYFRFKRRHEEAVGYYQLSIDVMMEQVGLYSGEELDLSKVGSNFSFNTTGLFNNAALSYDYLGDLEKAIQYYNFAHELTKVNPDNSLEEHEQAMLLQNLFRAYVNVEYDSLALQSFKQLHEFLPGIKSSELQSKTTSLSYKNMAMFYLNQNDYNNAKTYLDKAIQLNPEDDAKTYIYQLYGKTLAQQGNYQAALDSIVNAIIKTEKFWGYFNREMAKNHMIKADIYSQQKKYNLANEYYNSAINILRGEKKKSCDCKDINIQHISDKRLVLDIIEQKGSSLFNAGKIEHSLSCFELLHHIILELQQKYILSEESKYFLIQRTKKMYEKAIKIAVSQGDMEKAYWFSQSSRSMLLLQQIQDKTAIQAASLPDSITTIGKEIKLKLNEYKKNREEALLSGDENMKKKWEEAIFSQDKLYEEWLSSLEKEYPSYYNLKYNKIKFSFNALKKNIAIHHSTLLEYFLGEENLYIFTINNEGVHVEEKPLSTQFIQDIKIISQTVSQYDYSFDTFNKFNISSFRLYNQLIKNAIDNDRIKTKNIIIIPDEQLNLIPFEVLVTEKKEFNDKTPHYHQLNYLINDYNIAYHYSSNFIQSKGNQKNNNRKEFLGIAPTFKNRNIQELSNNISEIEGSFKFHNTEESTIIKGSDASYSNILESIKDYRIAHFATHALFNDQIPLDSRIELADTSLFIYEVFGMEHQLDLAIMSACETASGKRRKGEGVISLSKAFIQSGCQTVIASLWSVSDQKTSILMKDFHQYLVNEKNSNEALSKAKRKYINEAMTKNVHPFYWAGFIQIGLMKNNSSVGIPVYYWIMGVLVLLLVFGFIYLQRKKRF